MQDEPVATTDAKGDSGVGNGGGASSAQANQRPAESFLRSDIELSVEYRKDYYKYIIGISTALLAFTISFQPTLRVPPEHLWLEWIGWAGLGVAVGSGVRLQMVWSRFFSVTQKYLNKNKPEEGKAARKRYMKEKRVLEAVLLWAFLIGVSGVISFTAVNLKHIAPKDDSRTLVAPSAPPAPAAASPAPPAPGTAPTQLPAAPAGTGGTEKH